MTSSRVRAQWPQKLHGHRLFRESIQPDQHIAELDKEFRHKDRLDRFLWSHQQHVQKAGTRMRLRLENLEEDITDLTVRRIMNAV